MKQSSKLEKEAILYYQATCATRTAQRRYITSCEAFRARTGYELPIEGSEEMLKYTKKRYLAYKSARRTEYNAKRRFETAARNHR